MRNTDIWKGHFNNCCLLIFANVNMRVIVITFISAFDVIDGVIPMKSPYNNGADGIELLKLHTSL